jgi:hypothetical protein
MVSGRDVRRRRDRLHRNVLLHRQNVVDLGTDCAVVLNMVREAREGWVGRHGVDGPAAMSAAEALRTVEVALEPSTHLHWSQHSPNPGAMSAAVVE